MNKDLKRADGPGAEEAPPAPQPTKAYLVLNELKGMIGNKIMVFARGQHIPARMAEQMPALPTLISSGSLKEVYV
ncbi:MAG: hypothetical protein ACYDG4_15210 [Desulfuromonadaceae bacterium]